MVGGIENMNNIWEDEVWADTNCSAYKTEANGNGRYPTQMQWFTFLELVKEMRSEQKDIRTMFDFKTEEEFDAWAEESYEKQTDLESKVDIMIKELFK